METARQQLTKEEYEEFVQQTSNLHSDEKIREACLRYFSEYKNSVPNIPSDKLATTLRCCFFIAEKSQLTYNMKGEKVRGIGLSLNQFLKNSQLDDFIIILKEILKKIKITDPDAEADLTKAFKRISFLVNCHAKFDKIVQKLDLKERISESFGYSKIFVSFLWLVYIDAKNHILRNDLEVIENTCMLAHVIAFMLIYSWEYIRPAVFADKKLSSMKDISLFVKEKVLELFIIKDTGVYVPIANSFEDYFNGLVSTNVIRVTPGKTDFLSPDNINLNYKKLDYAFQKALTPEDIDQRIFFKDRAANLTPSKFTPLSRHGYVSKMAPKQAGRSNQLNNYDSNKQNFSSHRILTYEMIEKSESQTPKGVINMNQIKFPKQIINSPSLIKPTLICSTPMTTAMEMYNYLNEKAKKSKQNNYPTRKLDSMIVHLIQDILDRIDKGTDKRNEKTKEVKSTMIFSLYKLTSEEYVAQHPHDRDSQNFARAMLALCIELVLFVSNITMSFEDIEGFLETDRLDQWKACNFLLNFDRTIPSALKLHLLDLEVNIVSSKIWLDEQLVQHMNAFANGSTYEGPYGQALQKCFKRVLHQIAYQITQLSHVLKLDERVSENVFDTVKHLLVHYTNLLHNRHVDQMIICSVYANCRAAQIDLKFNEIKVKYEEVNFNNKPLHDDIICKVHLEDQRVDIIKFYNSAFIVHMRAFVTGLKESQPVHHNKAGAPILQSPLRAIIPKELSFNKIPSQANKKASKTPQTNLLYAYNESPILKYEMNAFKGTALQSRKVINFDKEEELLKKKCNEIAEQDDGLTQTNDFISKKFRKPPVITQQHPNPSHKTLFDRR